MSIEERKLRQKLPGIKANISLECFTTFRIGGPADWFYQAKTMNELVEAVRAARELRINYFILGGGSNLLISDRGFRGLVIAVRDRNYELQRTKILAAAGIPIRQLLEIASENSLGGLEFMAGIPGTLGGAIRGNAGAWQESIGNRVRRVKVLTNENEIRWLSHDDCQFEYRQSRFKKRGGIILQAELKLEKANKEKIEKKAKENLSKRLSQPKNPSAGCIFINPRQHLPLVSSAHFSHGSMRGEASHFSAGKLIESCGLKGRKIGDAQISVKHANFIVNLGKARAEDVLQLIELAQATVQKKFGIRLEIEICLVGFRKERKNGEIYY